MTNVNTPLTNSTTAVTSTLASGSTISSPHPQLHVEERDMLESLRVKVINDNATASAVVYGNAFRGTGYNATRPSTSSANMSWTCDGVGDNVEIQAAIDAVATAGGGSVKLIGPKFMVPAASRIRTAVSVEGEGRGTIVQASQDFVTNFGIFMLFDNTTHATQLKNLTLDGNGNDVYGVHYSATGGQVFNTPAPDTNPDPIHQIENLLIMSCGSATFAGHGMRMQGVNLRGGQYRNLSIRKNTGCGIWVNDSVDSHYTDIEIGSSGASGPAYSEDDAAPVGHAFFISGEQNVLQGCKGWYSRGAGFFLRGTRNRLMGCEAQDNYSYGFHGLHGKNIYIGCSADSNGQANGADGRGRDGFWLGSDTNVVVGCQSYDKQESSTTGWWQQYGFRFTGGLTDSYVTSCITWGNEQAGTIGTPGTGTTTQIISVAGK